MFMQPGPSGLYPQYSVNVDWSQGGGGQTQIVFAAVDLSLSPGDHDSIAEAIRDAIADFVSAKTVTSTQIVRCNETLTEL